jgi:bifunctional oligoribonuclease and PAP phosphatase NrnA
MTREAIIKYEVTDEQAASVVNLLSGIEGFPVWALFIEYPTEIRVRLRSNGPDIDKLANQYEGGGHAKAAGAKLKAWNDIKGFVTDVEAVVKRYLDTHEHM